MPQPQPTTERDHPQMYWYVVPLRNDCYRVAGSVTGRTLIIWPIT